MRCRVSSSSSTFGIRSTCSTRSTASCVTFRTFPYVVYEILCQDEDGFFPPFPITRVTRPRRDPERDANVSFAPVRFAASFFERR